MTDKEVFMHLVEVMDFNALKKKKKYLICDYLHYNLTYCMDFEDRDQKKREKKYNYHWNGSEDSRYSDGVSGPWGFEATGVTPDLQEFASHTGYSNIFDQSTVKILEVRQGYGILLEEDLVLNDNFFKFKFWDCNEETIDFSELGNFECEIGSECRLMFLQNKATVLRATIEKLQEELKTVEDDINHFTVETFAEAV